MTAKVNLDALIPRADFAIIETQTTTQGALSQTLPIRELEPTGSFFLPVLRKPDFQRETSSWSPQNVADFVKTFVSGDLIPAVILWRSPDSSTTFVIDGAHRLSALIAWVNDDYGDGPISIAYFAQAISEQQREIAERTRRLIKREIGAYQHHKIAPQTPEKFSPAIVEQANNLATVSIQLQWVTGDAYKAEASFFKINQKAVPLDPTELRLLRARRKPNALAARAILRAGYGHKYWSQFDEEKRVEIENLARQVHEALFKPIYTSPIKTLDLPVGGQSYSSQALSLVFELVNEANENSGKIDDDSTGDETIKFLKSVRRIAYRVSGDQPESLGLHPIVYFYSAEGRFQPTSFLAIISLLKQFGSDDFHTFTAHRFMFEEFLVRYKRFSNQVVQRWGSLLKGYAHLREMYRLILDGIIAGDGEPAILERLKGHKDFYFLSPQPYVPDEVGKDFSTDTKSQAFIRQAITTGVRCNICRARLHMKSITTDHDRAKQDGGGGDLQNAQPTHPFCNTGYKERLRSQSRRLTD